MANLHIVPTNHHDSATLTATTTASASFPVTDTQSPARDQAWRSNALTNQVISGTLPASVKASFIGVFRHLCHGGTIRVQLFSDAAWATPSSGWNDSGTVAIATNITLTNPPDWGLSDAQRTTDLLYYEQPYVLYFGQMVTFRSYKITFSGSPTNGSSYYEVGRIFLGPHFESTVNPDYGLTLGWSSNALSTRAVGGSRRASSASRWRRMEFTIGSISEADRPAFLDLMAYLGETGDAVVSLFPGAGGRPERDFTLNGAFADEDPVQYTNCVFHSKRFVFEEN